MSPGPDTLRVALPPSSAPLSGEHRACVEQLFGVATGLRVEVSVARSYDELAADLLSGRLNVAWAPPFACARLENAGVPIVARALRGGRATYRAALVCRADAAWKPDALQGARAAWVDRESTGGYLLVASALRARGVPLQRTFASQDFLGTYRAALTAVLARQADVTSTFAPPAAAGDTLDVEESLPGATSQLRALLFSDETPTDGVAVAPFTPAPLVRVIEQALVGPVAPPGRAQLFSLFRVERLEPAPKGGYRALYQALRLLR